MRLGGNDRARPDNLTSTSSTMREYKPTHRRLRLFALEPSCAATLDPRLEGTLTLQVPWEETTAGPSGEYLEVIDFDPASDCFYSPVDLNSPQLLAMDGIPPSEGDPRFHQQTVYA